VPTLQDLEVVPPDPKYTKAIAAFDCGHLDLNDFIRNDCMRQAEQRLAYTKLAFYKSEFVGYITLLSDSIILHESERTKFPLPTSQHSKLAGLEPITNIRGRESELP
jgi:hypothetical protein